MQEKRFEVGFWCERRSCEVVFRCESYSSRLHYMAVEGGNARCAKVHVTCVRRVKE